jgi:hypothetical protein
MDFSGRTPGVTLDPGGEYTLAVTVEEGSETTETFGDDTFPAYAVYGFVNQSDFTTIATLPGDANRDGKVSFADYLILEANFAKTGMTWAQGDFNNDGKVSFADYLLLEANFGKSIVPEPATLSLLALAGLAMLRRRMVTIQKR